MSFTAATEMAKLVDYHWESLIQETDEFSDNFYTRCKKMPAEKSNTLGRKVKVRTGYNESESWANFDGAGYAQGGNSTFQNFYVPYRTVSTKGLITKEAIDNDDEKSKYHPAVEEVNATLMTGMKKIERACLMGNGTAAIAAVTTNYSGGSPTVIVCAPGTTFGNKGSQFVKIGKKVNIYDATGATLRNGTIGGEGILTIATNTKSTGSMTATSNAPSDMVATDIVVPERSGGRGINGIPYWVSNTGSIFELSRSTYPGLQSTYVSGASGGLLVNIEKMFAEMAHYVAEDTALDGGHEAFWSPTQRQRYRNDSMGIGILELGASKLDAGYGHKEEINGYKFTTIKDHDNTKIHFLRMKDWVRIQVSEGEKPFEIIPVHGQKFFNVDDSAGRDSSGLAFNLGGYINIACTEVRSQAALHSLPTAGLATGN